MNKLYKPLLCCGLLSFTTAFDEFEGSGEEPLPILKDEQLLGGIQRHDSCNSECKSVWLKAVGKYLESHSEDIMNPECANHNEWYLNDVTNYGEQVINGIKHHADSLMLLNSNGKCTTEVHLVDPFVIERSWLDENTDSDAFEYGFESIDVTHDDYDSDEIIQYNRNQDNEIILGGIEYGSCEDCEGVFLDAIRDYVHENQEQIDEIDCRAADDWNIGKASNYSSQIVQGIIYRADSIEISNINPKCHTAIVLDHPYVVVFGNNVDFNWDDVTVTELLSKKELDISQRNSGLQDLASDYFEDDNQEWYDLATLEGRKSLFRSIDPFSVVNYNPSEWHDFWEICFGFYSYDECMEFYRASAEIWDENNENGSDGDSYNKKYTLLKSAMEKYN